MKHFDLFITHLLTALLLFVVILQIVLGFLYPEISGIIYWGNVFMSASVVAYLILKRVK